MSVESDPLFRLEKPAGEKPKTKKNTSFIVWPISILVITHHSYQMSLIPNSSIQSSAS